MVLLMTSKKYNYVNHSIVYVIFNVNLVRIFTGKLKKHIIFNHLYSKILLFRQKVGYPVTENEKMLTIQFNLVFSETDTGIASSKCWRREPLAPGVASLP